MPQQYSVLYVDDEPDLLEVAKIFLESSQEFTVHTAESAEDSLKLLEDHHYDAIVSDFQMPGMNGIAFLKKVRSSFGDIPFIIFTGRGREEVVIEALNNGADFYLQKGGEPETVYLELMHVIRRAIQMRQAQITLSEQEQRYHDIQNASDLIQSVAPDGRFLFVNKKWQDTLGYQEHELSGLTLFDIIDEESREHCMQLFPRVISGENVGIIDVVFRARDGRKVYIEGLASCKIVNGQPQYTRGIFKDVTDRKQMEAALAENRDYLDQIFSSVQGGIVIIDAKTHEIVDLNPAAAGMMGTTKDQIVNKVCHKYMCPSEQGRCPITDLHQKVDNTERVLLTAEGRKVPVIKYVVPFTFHGKQFLLETMLDHTAQKKAADDLRSAYEKVTAAEEELRHNYDTLSEKERALRESEEKFRTLVDYTIDGILILDPQGKILFANPASGKIIEKEDYQTVIGVNNVLDYIAPESKDDVLRDFSQVAQGIDGYIARYKIITAQQTERWVESIGKVITFGGVPAILISLRDITDRQRAETVVQESENRFRSIFESSPYPIAINSSPDQKFLAVNPAFLKVSGYSEAEVIGKTPVGIGLLSVTEAARLVSHAVLHGKIENVPLTLTVKAGKKVHVLFSTTPVTINGQPASLTVTAEVTQLKRVEEELIQKNEDLHAAFEELTATDEELRANYEELRKQEQALRASEEKFRALVEHSLEGIFITDFTGMLLFANQAAGRIVETDDYRSIIGRKNVMEYVAPESQATVLHDISQVAQGTDAYLVNYKLVTDRKREIWVECVGKKMVFGGSEAMLVSMRDITERKSAENARAKIEKALRESEEKFRMLVEHSLDGILILDLTGTILFRNRAAANIVETDIIDEQAGIKKVLDYIAPESRASVLHDFAQVIDGIDSYPVSYQAITEKGRQIWIECIGKKIVFRDAPAILVSLRDISSRKRMEEAILRTNQQLSLLSSVTRHDVLNKIAIIQGNIALARKRGQDNDFPALLNKIEATTNVIRDQVEFTRIYQNLGTKEPEWQKPGKILASEHIPKTVTLTNELGDLEIFADLMLEKVFHNLVDNSLRHGGTVTTIRVRSRTGPEGLVLTFEDNGVGIPDTEKTKIFERGYGKNTGLGLFLVREILTITGITIKETGEAGKGARFEILIPDTTYRSANA